jgi:hypothetical protein
MIGIARLPDLVLSAKQLISYLLWAFPRITATAGYMESCKSASNSHRNRVLKMDVIKNEMVVTILYDLPVWNFDFSKVRFNAYTGNTLNKNIKISDLLQSTERYMGLRRNLGS